MVDIPSELLEQFQHGNVLLFVGDLINYSPEGQYVTDQLRTRLAARCEISDLTRLYFPDIAEFYEDNHGHQELVQFVRDQLESLGGDAPCAAHHLIAGLTGSHVVVTTCLDQRLESAFGAAGRPLDVIIYDSDLPYEDGSKTQLYKLCGSRDQVDSLVLTRDQYDAFEDRANTSRVQTVLKGYLARKTILFLGCDLADQYFQRLYGKIIGPLDRHARRPYALSAASLSPIVSGWCKHCQIKVIGTDPAIFLDALIKELAHRPVSALGVQFPSIEELPAPPPKLPYKFLDYYEAEDAAIFFGRRQETQMLSSLIHAHRLVLLYGASGVGKTSLLLAGAVPSLESTEPSYATFYVRALDDPAAAIGRAVKRKLPDAPWPEDRGLVDQLDGAARHLRRTLIIILDQFEEFFISSSLQSQAAFIAELGALCDARDVPVKIVLSLREDWLAAVSRIEERIPEVFHNRMHLLPLTREQALSAIAMPVERLGIRYEPALVERLLDDLTSDKKSPVMPPELQIFCTALYGGLRPGDLLITLAAYEELGSARGVLQRYLDEVLTQLGGGERALAHGLLEELVTSQYTKAVKTADELALALNTSVSVLASVLRRLVRASLLRPVRRDDDAIAYELAHEYLIQEISLGAEAQTRKQAEELVEQEVHSWRRFGTLLAADKLALVDKARESLRLSAEAQELLLRSALVNRHETTAYWLKRVDNETRRAEIAHDCLTNTRPTIRAWTSQVLCTWDVPVVRDMLVERVLSDPDPNVLCEAARGLARIDSVRFLDCEREMLQGSPDRRQRAVEAIDCLEGAASEVLDQKWLTLYNLRWRLRWFRLRRNRARLIRVTLYTAAGGALGAAVGGASGAIVSHAPSNYFPWMVILAFMIGLVIGACVGFGFGSVKAMDERDLLLYIVAAMLGGGVAGLLTAVGTHPTLRGEVIGLVGGMTIGGSVALVVKLTERIMSPTRRAAIRLAFAVLVGAIPGLVFAVGAQIGVYMSEFSFGLGFGLMMMLGIVGGLELAERELGQPGQSNKTGKTRMESKGGQS